LFLKRRELLRNNIEKRETEIETLKRNINIDTHKQTHIFDKLRILYTNPTCSVEPSHSYYSLKKNTDKNYSCGNYNINIHTNQIYNDEIILRKINDKLYRFKYSQFDTRCIIYELNEYVYVGHDHNDYKKLDKSTITDTELKELNQFLSTITLTLAVP
jgi:hypothetical protein